MVAFKRSIKGDFKTILEINTIFDLGPGLDDTFVIAAEAEWLKLGRKWRSMAIHFKKSTNMLANCVR